MLKGDSPETVAVTFKPTPTAKAIIAVASGKKTLSNRSEISIRATVVAETNSEAVKVAKRVPSD